MGRYGRGHNTSGGRGIVSRRVFLKSAARAAMVPAMMSLSCASNRPADRKASRAVRFGIVTDCHYADRDPAGTRFHRQSLAKLAECVDAMNAQRVDFLIELGDFKDQGDPPVEECTLSYLRDIEAVFARFEGPRHHVLGNHDMDSLSKDQFLANVQNTGIDAGCSHYSFDVGGLHGIVLDANYTSDGGDYDHGNFDWPDTNVPTAQLDWLARDLASADGPVIVFVHQLLDGEGPIFVNNAGDVRKVLESCPDVIAVFQGHEHVGRYSLINGVHYYTLKAMVEGPGPEDNAYAIVEIHTDLGMTVTGYHQATSQELSRLTLAAAD